jgi:hypothetical protein
VRRARCSVFSMRARHRGSVDGRGGVRAPASMRPEGWRGEQAPTNQPPPNPKARPNEEAEERARKKREEQRESSRGEWIKGVSLNAELSWVP